MKKYTEEEKKCIIEMYSAGCSVGELSSQTSIPRSTIYSWINEFGKLESETEGCILTKVSCP